MFGLRGQSNQKFNHLNYSSILAAGCEVNSINFDINLNSTILTLLLNTEGLIEVVV